jgi:M6 family metalloprotease-like protein
MNTKRFYGAVFLALFFCSAGLCRLVWAVPAAPILHELTQPDGATIKAVKWGDEYRHGWETASGYAIRFDEQSRHWKYAARDAAGKSAVLPARAGIDQPPPELQRHSERTLDQIDSTRLFNQRLPLPSKAVPPTGTGNLLVILVNFSDTDNSTTRADFHSLLFDNDTFSMKDYYEEVSYGAFTVSPGPGGITGWYTAANPHDYYGQNDAYGDDRWPGTLVREAVAAADAAGFNFAPYDQDGDGYVDQVAIVHQGTGEEASPNANDIWSHSWDLNSAYSYRSGYSDGGAYLTNDGVTVNSYITMPEIFLGGISTMGVFAHEYGHALGLPDLYDTDYTSEGVGNWSLMAGGSWNYVTLDGDRPAHLDAWCKYALGWVTPTIVSSVQDNITIAQASENDDVYQFLAGRPNAGGEYFLVENRQRTTGSFDSALPGAGLLIWHIDENITDPIWGTINDSECESGPGSPTCVSAHYHVALMQADCLWGLEKNSNRGDAGDPFPGTGNNRAFSYGTSPGSRLWSGASSNVAITGISDSGPVMSFNFSNSTTTTTARPTTTTTTTAPPVCTDTDGDGYGVGPGCAKAQDCDDADPDVHPEADEICRDGIDNNCDGQTDENCKRKCFFVKVLGEDNPRLDAVRWFRDNKLAKSAFGRMIIRLYYGKEDWIHDALERNPSLKSAVKSVLETVIP